MVAGPKQKKSASTFSSDSLPYGILTVIKNLMQRCCAKTTKALPMFNTARTENSGGDTAQDDKTVALLFTASITRWNPVEDEHSRRTFWQNFWFELFASN